MAELSWGDRVTIVSGKLAYILEELSQIRFLVEKAYVDKHPNVAQLESKIIDGVCDLFEMFSKEEHNRFHELFKAISNMSIDKVPFKYDPDADEYKNMRTSRDICLTALLDIRDRCKETWKFESSQATLFKKDVEVIVNAAITNQKRKDPTS